MAMFKLVMQQIEKKRLFFAVRLLVPPKRRVPPRELCSPFPKSSFSRWVGLVWHHSVRQTCSRMWLVVILLLSYDLLIISTNRFISLYIIISCHDYIIRFRLKFIIIENSQFQIVLNVMSHGKKTEQTTLESTWGVPKFHGGRTTPPKGDFPIIDRLHTLISHCWRLTSSQWTLAIIFRKCIGYPIIVKIVKCPCEPLYPPILQVYPHRFHNLSI